MICTWCLLPWFSQIVDCECSSSWWWCCSSMPLVIVLFLLFWLALFVGMCIRNWDPWQFYIWEYIAWLVCLFPLLMWLVCGLFLEQRAFVHSFWGLSERSVCFSCCCVGIRSLTAVVVSSSSSSSLSLSCSLFLGRFVWGFGALKRLLSWSGKTTVPWLLCFVAITWLHSVKFVIVCGV